MKIAVIACFFREEFLVPFFLSHYYWAAEIHALVSPGDEATTHALAADARVRLHTLTMPAGFDDLRKIQRLNEVALSLAGSADWLVVVDSDEFIWPFGQPAGDAREYLRHVSAVQTVVEAKMWQVFRHESDTDVDPAKTPVVLQRRHGVAERTGPGLRGYCKPIVVRARCRLQWQPGQHALLPNPAAVTGNAAFDGAHWASADAAFCVHRAVAGRAQRLAPESLARGHGVHYAHVTEESIRARLTEHAHDPQIF